MRCYHRKPFLPTESRYQSNSILARIQTHHEVIGPLTKALAYVHYTILTRTSLNAISELPGTTLKRREEVVYSVNFEVVSALRFKYCTSVSLRGRSECLIPDLFTCSVLFSLLFEKERRAFDMSWEAVGVAFDHLMHGPIDNVESLAVIDRQRVRPCFMLQYMLYFCLE